MLRAAKNVFKADYDCPVVPLEPRRDEGNDIAVLAGGDFMANQKKFRQLEGVQRVICGYTGGAKDIPTFTKVHGHSEALLIEFNPTIISYNNILENWREFIDPWEKEKAQFRAAIFWKSLRQQDEALNFVENLQSEQPSKKLYVEVERARRFFRANQAYPSIPLEPKRKGNEISILTCGDLKGQLDRFQEIGGVERIVTGFTGGKQENPRDDMPHDHKQAILIEHAPILPFRQILEIWDEIEKPFREEEARRHRESIFWKTLTQQNEALNFVEELRAKNPTANVFLDVERVYKFYEVETDRDSNLIVAAPRRNLSLSPKLGRSKRNKSPKADRPPTKADDGIGRKP